MDLPTGVLHHLRSAVMPTSRRRNWIRSQSLSPSRSFFAPHSRSAGNNLEPAVTLELTLERMNEADGQTRCCEYDSYAIAFEQQHALVGATAH
jgi:hypothetical protein